MTERTPSPYHVYMADIIEFPSLEAQFQVELERRLEERFKDYPADLRRAVKDRAKEKLGEIRERKPIFHFEAPPGMPPDSIAELRRLAERMIAAYWNIALDVITLEVALMIERGVPPEV